MIPVMINLTVALESAFDSISADYSNKEVRCVIAALIFKIITTYVTNML